MALANLGSIATRIHNQVQVPASISGTELLAIIYDKVLFMQEFTGLAIGSTAIAERFQPALMNLSKAEVLNNDSALAGGNTSSYSLAELTIQKSAGDGSLSAQFEKQGMEQLKRLGRQFKSYKAYG